MPRRNLLFATNEYYHIFNRTVGKEIIFTDKRNVSRVLDLIEYYRFLQPIRYSQWKLLSQEKKQQSAVVMNKQDPLVKIVAFAFMPNHFHFLLQQTQERGIYNFLSNIQNGFAKFFNIKQRRHGSLFIKPFKAKWIETDEDFLHVARYIHLNPVTSYLIEPHFLNRYPWTSFSWYMDDSRNRFVDTKPIKEFFKNDRKHLQFVLDQADYQRDLHQIKHLLVD